MQDYIPGMLHNIDMYLQDNKTDFSSSTDFCAKFSNDNDLRLLMVTIIKIIN